jgi:predicted HicB family RNase H-like nuclease
MSDVLEYKGFLGSASYSGEDEVFHGKLEGIRDLVTYEGADVRGLKQAFREAVDDYIETCSHQGREPDSPFKGSFNVRVGTDLHKRTATYAIEHHKKLNSVVTEALECFLASAP